MAKIGEGDPRWIVAEREDGANVNNWHWVEKDCSNWAKTRLKELYNNLPLFQGEGFIATVTSTDKVEGEVSINTRKGKVFYFFELDLKMGWECQVFKQDGSLSNTVKGSLNMEEISQESEDNFEIHVSAEGSGEEVYKAKEQVRKKCPDVIRQTFAKFLRELREEKKVAPPLRETSKKDLSSTPATGVKLDTSSPLSTERKEDSPSGSKTKTIKQTVTFNCAPANIFNTLLDERCVSAFTQSSAQVSREAGGKFVLFGGNITGENVEIVPNKKIVQKWRLKEWPEGHYSTVNITLEGDEKTTLKLEQTSVPINEVERTEHGWRSFFWERINMLFGFGFSIKNSF